MQCRNGTNRVGAQPPGTVVNRDQQLGPFRPADDAIQRGHQSAVTVLHCRSGMWDWATGDAEMPRAGASLAQPPPIRWDAISVEMSINWQGA